jgi:hypothetical protein
MRKLDAAAAGLFVVLAVAMTWPLACALDRAVAYPGDPFINIWILDWDWYATFHQPLALFQANIFYPARYALAYSENLYGLALLLFPLRAVGVGPVVAFNLAMIGGFAFTGFSAYLLGRMVVEEWSGDASPQLAALAGVVAGIFFTAVPFRFTQLPHIQHIWSGWPPLMLAALLAYRRAPSWPRAILFGAAFLMNGLTNIHWLLFGSLAIAVSLPIVIPSPRRWPAIVVVTLIALALLAPFLVSYREAANLYGMERTWGEAKHYSATLRDWLNPGVANRFYRRFAETSVDAERWLFPGALGMALSAAGFLVMAVGLRHAAEPARLSRQRLLALALLWLLLGVIGSLGLHAFFHRFLFTYVPGFRALRVPARWAMAGYLGMAMAIAVATYALARRYRWTAAMVPLLFLIELRAAPIRWISTTASQVPPVYRWLAGQPIRGGVLELPLDVDELEYTYTLRAAAHHKPVANGASGFVPPEFVRLATMTKATPVDPRLIGELASANISTLIVHGDFLDSRSPLRDWLRTELRSGRLRFLGRFDYRLHGDWAFAVDAAGRGNGTIAPQVADFLDGRYTRNLSTFGQLDYPRGSEPLGKNTLFSGWVLSPYGIRRVNLLFDNGTVRYPARLIAEPTLSAAMPWYDAAPLPRFIAPFERRPANVRPDTDVQVEIIDGRGERTLLEGRLIDWRP